MSANDRGDDHEFENFLEYLSTSRNFDFTAYKRASLRRRLQKRMDAVGLDSYTDYTDYLEVHPDEFTELFNTILINVTSFFRDPPAWEYIAQHVIPEVLNRRDGLPIRVWTAGTSSGEEAYSMGMLLCEAMGEHEFRQRVKIYATDVDEEALNTARLGVYSERELRDVSDALRDRYFEPSNGKFAVRKDFRRSVIFGRHDLLNDAPISRVDILSCRNTLMYFHSEAQGRVVARFLFALNENGFLILGKAETLLTHTAALTPVDLKLRVFQNRARIPRGAGPPPPASERERLTSEREGLTNERERLTSEREQFVMSQVRMREVAYEVDPLAQITVDYTGIVVAINERARALFGLRMTDVGRPFHELEVSYRPQELRSVIDEVRDESRGRSLNGVSWDVAGQTHWLDIEVVPLPDPSGETLGVKLVFNDVTRFHDLQAELQQSNNALETAYEELQSSNEELETTNEELQSTVEELETTNEELQSTNEELETMNEELQSTNEELQAVHAQTRERAVEIDEANELLESILASMRLAVVVVDADARVLAWNRRSEDLWGLRREEVLKRPFFNLDIGLPVGELQPLIRGAARGTEARGELVVTATNRRGKSIECAVSALPLSGADGIGGVVLLMEESEPA